MLNSLHFISVNRNSGTGWKCQKANAVYRKTLEFQHLFGISNVGPADLLDYWLYVLFMHTLLIHGLLNMQ